MQNKSKNIIIGILLFLLICALIVIYFLTTNKKENDVIKEMTATIIVADSKYVIAESNNQDYLIPNIKGAYSVGDVVRFTYKASELNNNESPYTLKIVDEDIIKHVAESEAINSSTEINTSSNNSKEENNTNTSNNTNNSNQTNSNTTSNQASSSSTSNTNTSVSNSSNTTTSTTTKPNASNNTSSNSVSKPNAGSSNSNTITNSTPDEEVLTYFNNLEKEFNATSLKDGLKSEFIRVIDFMFYNGTIKGYTFDGLSNTAKLKVLSVALYFDSKIDKYFSGYKESIANATTKVYTNIKARIVTLYLNLTTTICSNNSELCASAKEGFNDLKTNVGISWNLIKEIAGDGFTSLKNWYEIWSGK
ncbi:MAG: hypothetical protein K2J20_01340 [Bacilli bacterium]|nr:hypothetical protein [Bacilli bacterium]